MSASTTSTLIGRRYLLHNPLGQGGMGTVYRATDRLSGQLVALKRVTSLQDQLQGTPGSDSADFRLALSDEFRNLASLRHPNIITVLDYGFDTAGQPFFTMELLESARTILDAGRDAAAEMQIQLLVELLQALAYLHRRGILHRDLKPGNVLVDASGTVKVLDFGLSLATAYSRSRVQATTVGTLAYMAPELFAEEAASIASDLYAVGVIACEMLAGHHPYNLKNVALLVHSILNAPPDLSGLDNGIEPVLERLLAKNPPERYPTAEDTIRALCGVSGWPVPVETAAIRESFLQAAIFVGRDDELGQLRTALNEAFNSRGSAWLVGGESGVGKSRLLEELRIRALVRGALVLSGQAISEGSSPYQLWRDPLRWLCLSSDIDDNEAGVLKAVIPDIADLLGRDVADAPPLDPQTTQNRLTSVVMAMFRRQTQPVMVILEDLQWAGSESLAALNALNAIVAELPLLVLASYRDDERPHLPELLVGMQPFRLQRLAETDIAELSASMLGAAGRDPHVVSLLQRETEGNVFFLIEVIRALSEEAGQLDQIAVMTLPHKVFARGIQTALQRRLGRVPEDAHPLLRLAAIAGRELDLNVLHAIVGTDEPLLPTMDLDAWLTTCANAAVLDVQENRWRFTHDKLREHVLNGLNDTERSGLYRQVAEAVEAVYTFSLDQVATLAYLWGVAGDQSKELYYAERAGQRAIRNSAYVEAIRLFKRALELLATQPDTLERAEQELNLQLALGPALINTRGFQASEVGQVYTRAKELARRTGNASNLFHALWGLWINTPSSNDIYTRAQEIIRTLFELARQLGDDDLLLESHHAAWSNDLFHGAAASAQEHFDKGLAIYRPEKHHGHVTLYGHDPGVCALALSSWNLWLLGYPDRACEQSSKALDLAQQLAHPFALGHGLLAKVLVHHWRDEAQEAADWSRKLMAHASEHGFPWFRAVATATYGWTLVMEGHDADGFAHIYEALRILDNAGGMVGQRNEMIATLLQACCVSGRVEDGIRIVTDEISTHNSAGQRMYEPEILRLHGELLLMRNADQEAAETAFRLALDLARQQSVRSLELRTAMSLTRLWQTQGKTAEGHELLNSIYNWFAEGFDTADLQETKKLIAELAQT